MAMFIRMFGLSVLSCLSLAGLAQASAPAIGPSGVRPAQQAETVSLDQLRQGAGLAPVSRENGSGPLTDLGRAYIDAMANQSSSDPADEPADLVYCSCNLVMDIGGVPTWVTPGSFAASRGVQGSFGAWVLDAAYGLDNLPQGEGLELFLDARLKSVAELPYRPTYQGKDRKLIFAELSAGEPQLNISADPLDATDPTALYWTSPAAEGFRIDIKNRKGWLKKFEGKSPEGYDYSPGFAGLRMNYWDPGQEMSKGLRLAWGAEYRISQAGLSDQFKTKGAQSSSKGFQWAGSAKGKYKRMILASIRKMSPVFRRMVDKVAPFTKVAVHKGGGSSLANYDPQNRNTPFSISFDRSHLAMLKFRREVIAHELGHIIDFAGFDEDSYKAFKRLLHKSKKWRYCSSVGYRPPSAGPSRWPCSEDMEMLADQFAYAAVGKRSGIGGYGTPILAKRSKMLALMEQQFAFLSPYGGQTLASSEWDSASIASRPEPLTIVDRFPVE